MPENADAATPSHTARSMPKRFILTITCLALMARLVAGEPAPPSFADGFGKLNALMPSRPGLRMQWVEIQDPPNPPNHVLSTLVKSTRGNGWLFEGEGPAMAIPFGHATPSALDHLGEALFAEAADKFFSNWDWRAYHDTLGELVRKLPRGWDARPAVALVLQSTAMRVENKPPAEPAIEGAGWRWRDDPAPRILADGAPGHRRGGFGWRGFQPGGPAHQARHPCPARAGRARG